ncbi:MAG: HIT domain-containing protein [Thermoprotei archaeon]|nr:HIT domain-containing protein [Thermoprotei archaeon]
MSWPKSWLSVLWAPWRMAYLSSITSAGEPGVCVLCEAPKLSDEEALIIYRGSRAYVILNRYPYNTGHLMIVPYKHVSSVEDLDEGDIVEVGRLLKASLKALREAYSPQGFNVGVNIGEAAGAGIPGHVHVHVVPRWFGDTNYMVVTGGVKVMPQLLEDTFKTLKPLMVKALRG